MCKVMRCDVRVVALLSGCTWSEKRKVIKQSTLLQPVAGTRAISASVDDRVRAVMAMLPHYTHSLVDESGERVLFVMDEFGSRLTALSDDAAANFRVVPFQVRWRRRCCWLWWLCVCVCVCARACDVIILYVTWSSRLHRF